MNLINVLNMWEVTHICDKGLKYLRNDKNMWEMT